METADMVERVASAEIVRLNSENAKLREALIYLVNAHEHPAAAQGRRGVLVYLPEALSRARTALDAKQ